MSEEIDTEQLRTELETIKDAMGLQERYGSEIRLWLVYAVLVGLAALGSQAVVAFELPGWGHWVSWGLFMGLGAVYQWLAADGMEATSTGTKPDLGLQYVFVFAYALVVLVAVAPAFEAATPTAASSVVFAVAVGAVGTAYLLVGNTLKAYYIRRRDRFAFYVGGAWMLLLAALLPRVPLLRRWGYAAFGVVFAVHAAGTYLYLR